MPIQYVDQSTLSGLSLPYRTCHALLVTGIECLSRSAGISKERGLDPAVIAEITAAMALASAARAMIIALHQSGRTSERTTTNGLAMGRAE